MRMTAEVARRTGPDDTRRFYELLYTLYKSWPVRIWLESG